MLIPLIVTLSLFVQVCTAYIQDVSLARLTENQVSQPSRYSATALLSNGDVVVGGFTNGLAGFSSAGGRDFLLQRYSPSGSLVWTKVFGDVGHDTIAAVAVDSSDNIYATGTTNPTLGNLPLNDVYVAKFDSSGNNIFSTKIGGTGEDNGIALLVNSATNAIFVAGLTKSSTFYDVPLTGGINFVDAYLFKLDSITGAVISNTQQGVAGNNCVFNGLTLDSTGSVWATGYTTGPTYLGTTSKGSFDFIVQKFSSSGTSLFADLLGSVGQELGGYIASDSSDNVYVTGWSGGAVDGQPALGSHTYDILLTKYNSAGTKLWTKILGSSTQDGAFAISVDSAQSLVYITGYVQTATFYGATTPSSTTQTPFLLIASTTDGSYVSSAIYPATGGNAIAYGITTRGPLVYIVGDTVADFQGQSNQGGSGVGAGFLIQVDTSASVAPTIAVTAAPTTIAPTADPTVSPTDMPTASPTAVCMHWALGDYGESCSTTCSKLSRTCKDKYLKDIVTQEAFYAVVGSAVNSRTGGAVGTAETFCSLTPESVVTVGAPAALSVVLSSEDHHSPVRTSCSYPASVAEVTVGCDDVLPLHNYRRFCPCLDHNCDGAWYLGYSGDSCDATCTSAGGVCDAEPLSNIVSAGEFSAMVASTTVVETNELIGESSAEFCHEGINILPLAPAPSVITLTFGAVNETLCAYPTSVSDLQGSCDMAFTDLPAQRFCNCKVTGPASHPHRMLLAPAAVTAPEPAVAVQATPRLRGKA